MSRRAAGLGRVPGPCQDSPREDRVPPVRDSRSVPPLVDGDEHCQILGCGRTYLNAALANGFPHLNIGAERRA
jgi:hypothetical protein